MVSFLLVRAFSILSRRVRRPSRDMDRRETARAPDNVGTGSARGSEPDTGNALVQDRMALMMVASMISR